MEANGKLFLLLAAVLASSTAIAVAFARGAFELGGSTRTEVRQSPDGLPDTVIEPNFPDPATVPTPVLDGPFRIISWGWPGGAENYYAGGPTGAISRTSDETVIKANDLYVELPPVPGESAGRQISATRFGTDVVELHIAIAVGSSRIEIVRWEPELPFNVERPAEDGAFSFGTGSVGGSPAVFYRWRRGGTPDNSIWFIREGVLTQINAALDFDAVMKIAEMIP